MESILLSKDPGKAFGDIFRRIQRLEQGISSPSTTGGGSGQFESILLGPSGNQIILDIVPPDPPTGVTATPGAFEDLSFVDVDWPVTTGANSYQAELAENLAGVRSIVDQGQTVASNYRFENLDVTKNYSVRVSSFNRVGITGAFSEWVDFTPIADLFGPAAPTGVAFARGPLSVIAKWNQNTEPDVANGNGIYIVQVAPSSTFSVIFREARIGGTIAVFNDLYDESDYFVRVAAIDSSGNQGPWTIASGISGGIVGNMILAENIYSSHIQVNTLEGDRIKANTINVAKLLADSILAKNINIGAGGQFKVGNPPSGSGLVINSQGLSLYNSSGARTIYLNALDGAGTFTGTISGSIISGGQIIGTNYKSAPSAPYVEIISGGNTASVYFKSNLSSETSPGQIRQITLPQSVGSGPINDTAILFMRPCFLESTETVASLALHAKSNLGDFGSQFILSAGDGFPPLVTGSASTGSLELLATFSRFIKLNSTSIDVKFQSDVQLELSSTFAKMKHGQQEVYLSSLGTQIYSFGFQVAKFYSLGGESHLSMTNLAPNSTSALVRWNGANGEFHYDSSSEKTKNSIGPLAETYDANKIIDGMRPIAYEELDRETNRNRPYRYIGLSAEALHEFAPQLVCCDEQGDPMSILYDKISVVAIAGVKDLRARVAQLETFISKMSPKEAD